MRRVSVGILLLVPFLAGWPAAGEEDAAEIRRLLRVVQGAEGDEAWSEAVVTLRHGSEEGREALFSLLEKMLRPARRDLERARDRVDGLAAKIGDGRGAARALAAWDEARAAAHDWIFDEERFPVPAHALITGPCEGYGEARKRGDRAVQTWDALARHLNRALRPARGLDRRRAEGYGAALREAGTQFDRLFRNLPDARRGELPASADPFALLLLDLRSGRFRGAAEAFATTGPGWRRLCLFQAYAGALLDQNEAHPHDMREDALEGIRQINAYRIALGISPVRHDPRLVRTARGHSEEMTRQGYFSHRSPVEARATKELRAALEGYEANVVECITGVGGGTSAVEFWKWDGGHHRDMIEPRWVDGGFSTRGPAVYVGGMGDEQSVPVLQY